jgi:hypothetical protein
MLHAMTKNDVMNTECAVGIIGQSKRWQANGQPGIIHDDK